MFNVITTVHRIAVRSVLQRINIIEMLLPPMQQSTKSIITARHMVIRIMPTLSRNTAHTQITTLRGTVPPIHHGITTLEVSVEPPLLKGVNTKNVPLWIPHTTVSIKILPRLTMLHTFCIHTFQSFIHVMHDMTMDAMMAVVCFVPSNLLLCRVMILIQWSKMMLALMATWMPFNCFRVMSMTTSSAIRLVSTIWMNTASLNGRITPMMD
mmetsp:Transcript_20822/g.45076  ORF Transcript_20822/g.45076 Transcript_20822/m.45076 type:complete len:210 (+) Transcript_20822:888-1517(+)